MKQKGQLAQLPAGVVLFGVAVIVMAVIGIVLQEFQDTQTANSIGFNVTADGLAGVDTMSDFNTVLAIVVIASVILGLVVTGFLVTRR